MDDITKKRKLLERIYADIAQYFEIYGPVPHIIIGARYGKLAHNFGGISNLLHELEIEGTINSTILRTGRKIFTIPSARRIESSRKV